MTKNLNTSQPAQQKKVWQKPELYILDTVNAGAKIHPNVHEATGHPVSGGFANTQDSGFSGTKYQAIS